MGVMLWVGWGWYVVNRFPIGTELSPGVQQALAARGQFGDMFGGINALFTALILAGAIYTVWLQQKELSAMLRQQDESKKESDRIALLTAYTALINAKSTQWEASYKLCKEIQPAMQKADPSTEQAGTLFMMLQAQGAFMSKALKDIDKLSEDLESLVKTIRVSNGEE
ncbi:MAG: hypothetical protein JW989_03835 [Chlorobiaceae bacterium]|jgi:hypothetical protein|nr:hypothetical protein [Chlorobiaceae bacterium]